MNSKKYFVFPSLTYFIFFPELTGSPDNFIWLFNQRTDSDKFSFIENFINTFDWGSSVIEWFNKKGAKIDLNKFKKWAQLYGSPELLFWIQKKKKIDLI